MDDLHCSEESSIRDIRDLVTRKSGLRILERDFDKFRHTIQQRVKKSGQHDCQEYCLLLESEEVATGKEWHGLLAEITVGESYFFRDPGQYEILEHLILPELIQRNKASRRLRIWSAGCARGEEPYSIAILLDKLLPKGEIWDIRIVATDINHQALEHAREGIYGEWSFRRQTADFKQRYFTRHKKGWRLASPIRDMVTFHYGNLHDDNSPCPGAFLSELDLIVCRNVFIYFNADVIAAVLAHFAYSLRPGGYLLTGHSEVYGHQLGPLRARIYPESVVYQREEEAPSPTFPELSATSPIADRMTRQLSKTSLKFRKPVIARGRWKAASEAERPLTRPPPSLPPATLRPASATVEPPGTVQVWFKEAQNLFRAGKYQASIVKTRSIVKEDAGHFGAHLLMAWSHANTGNYEEAVIAAGKAMLLQEFSSAPYYLLAHIADISENTDEVKRCLQKTIYLEPSFVAAYLDLAALFEREGNQKKAASMRHTALDLLLDLDPRKRIEPYNELNVAELVDYVRNLLAGSHNDRG